MSWWQSILSRLRREPVVETRRYGFARTPAGVWVDHDLILTIGAVNACVRAIAETMGVLEWALFQEDPRTGERSKRWDVPLQRILSLQPNGEMTSQTFREVLTAHALIYGNGYAEIVRDGAGRPAELWPILPDRCSPKRIDGQLVYEVRTSNSDTVYLPASEVFHLKGLGYDGIKGYDVVSYMSTSAGYGLAIETYSSAFFGNGAHLSGILKSKKQLSPEARKKLVEGFNDAHQGANKAWRLMVIEEDMDYQAISVTPEQAQMIESRKFSVEDIARWFRVPLHKIGHLERAHFNNVEQLGIQFVTDTILPWATRFEQEADTKLLGSHLRVNHYTKMNVVTLTRGDLKSRMEAYRIGREWGWYSPNDIRELEGLEPISAEDGGNFYMVPLNQQLAAGAQKDLEAKDEPEEPEESPVEAMRSSVRDACTRVIARESNYIGRKFDQDGFNLSKCLDNQRDYAQGVLFPVLSDMVKAIGKEPMATLNSVCALYLQRHFDIWASAMHANEKPDLGSMAALLENDIYTVVRA